MDPDDKNTDGTGEDDASTGDDASSGGDGSDQIANLNKALTQARTAEKAAKDALATKTAADEAAKTKKAEEAGEFERLYKDADAALTTANEQLTAHTARETTRLETVTTDADAIVAKWPDADKALDPKSLAPDARLRMVRQLDARFSATDRPAGTRSKGSDEDAPIPDWVKDNFREFNGADAPNDEKLRWWMGLLKKEPKYADKFKTT